MRRSREKLAALALLVLLATLFLGFADLVYRARKAARADARIEQTLDTLNNVVRPRLN